MAHKNDYSCIVFYKGGKPKKWQFIHSLTKFVAFLEKDHPGWEYINVYERRTAKYLRRFYPGNSIPYFLTPLLFAFALHFFLTFNKSPYRSTFTNGIYNSATISTAKWKGGYQCL